MDSLYSMCAQKVITSGDYVNCDMYHGKHSIVDLQEVAQRLKHRAQFMGEYSSSKKQNILIAGCVQSGKTNELLSYCWWSIFVCRRMIIFLTRNIKADTNQLIDRIKFFNENFIKNPDLFIEISAPLSKKIGIVISMANYSRINTLNIVLSEVKFNLCIDEVDTTIKSRTKKNSSYKMESVFKKLEEKSSHQVGATATQFAVFAGRISSLDKVLKMKNPRNYYGIDKLKLKFVTVHPDFLAYENAHLDSNIPIIYDQLMKRQEGFVMLHSTTKIKDIQYLVASRIYRDYPSITTLVINGNGIKFYCKDNNISPEIYKNLKINDALQMIKSHPRIAIVAGNIASRGVSFVSSDYNRHITDQYYVPSKTTHGESLLQGLRILGCYSDNKKLRLWCEKNVWACINQHYRILNKIVDATSNSSDIPAAFSNAQVEIPVRKYSRPKIMQGLEYVASEDNIKLKFNEIIEQV
jgi:hypothetical protein